MSDFSKSSPRKSKLALSLLYVEDEDDAREILQKKLINTVERVTVACSADEGAELFKKGSFDVVVTDIQTGGKLDGLGLSEEIKKSSPETFIIVVSAYNDTQLLSRAIDIGVDKYLIKPLRFQTITDILKHSSKRIEERKELKIKTKILKEYTHALDASAIVSKGDVYGNITYVNDKFCEISEYSREELIGRPHSIVRHPITPSTTFEEMWKTILNKQIWRGRITNRKKSGGRYIVETTITPILNEDGEIMEFFSIRNDVTKFVEMGRKIKRHEQERIELERHHLEEMNRSKDMLLSIFTHELKTPLNAIINFSTIVSNRIGEIKEIDSQDIHEYLNAVNESGQFMLSQITNILEILKIKSEKFEPNIRKFDLSNLLSEILFKQQKGIAEHHLILERFCREDVEILNDHNSMARILENLLSNAIKYAKDTISVTLTDELENYCIIIEDNGSGFKKEIDALTIFGQEDEDALTRTSSGIGLGLHFVILASKKLGISLNIGRSERLGGAKVTLSGSKSKGAE